MTTTIARPPASLIAVRAVDFTAPEDGTYIFQAKNLAFFKGTYTLTVSGATAPQLTVIELGEAPIWDGDSEAPGRMTTFEGQLEVKGEGSHVVQLQEGERVAALAACEADDNSLRTMDPLLRVLDPADMLVLQVDDSLDYQDCAAWYSAYGEFTPAITGRIHLYRAQCGQRDQRPLFARPSATYAERALQCGPAREREAKAPLSPVVAMPAWARSARSVAFSS